MLHKNSISESSGIVTKDFDEEDTNYLASAKRKVKAPSQIIIDTQNNVTRSNLWRKKDTSVRTVQNRKIGK